MTKLKNNDVPETITREFIEETITTATAELIKELKKEIPAAQFKVDADKIVKVGLDQLGFKIDWKNRVMWFAGGLIVASVGWLPFVF
jgi:hypothetical protein